MIKLTLLPVAVVVLKIDGVEPVLPSDFRVEAEPIGPLGCLVWVSLLQRPHSLLLGLLRLLLLLECKSVVHYEYWL